jgi:hypothetical protein
VAELFEVELRHGLEKLAREIGGLTSVECEFFLVGQELAVDVGDYGAGGAIRMVWGGFRVDGRIKGNAFGLD